MGVEDTTKAVELVSRVLTAVTTLNKFRETFPNGVKGAIELFEKTYPEHSWLLNNLK